MKAAAILMAKMRGHATYVELARRASDATVQRGRAQGSLAALPGNILSRKAALSASVKIASGLCRAMAVMGFVRIVWSK